MACSKVLQVAVMLILWTMPVHAQTPPQASLRSAAPQEIADRQTMRDVLRAVAEYVRRSAGGDRLIRADWEKFNANAAANGVGNPSSPESSRDFIVDSRFHSMSGLEGARGHIMGAPHEHIPIAAEELAILRTGLGPNTISDLRENVLKNCEKPAECELIGANSLVSFSKPMLQPHGTVVITVERHFRTGNPRQDVFWSTRELTLAPDARGWSIVQGPPGAGIVVVE